MGPKEVTDAELSSGTMSYGDPEWAGWLLGEKEGIEHVKFAYVLPD